MPPSLEKQLPLRKKLKKVAVFSWFLTCIVFAMFTALFSDLIVGSGEFCEGSLKRTLKMKKHVAERRGKRAGRTKEVDRTGAR